MVFADSRLWIGENDGNDIQVYNPDRSWVNRFGTQGPAVGQFKQGVQGLYVDSAQGKVFATDVGNCRLQVFDESFVLANTPHLMCYQRKNGHFEFRAIDQKLALSQALEFHRSHEPGPLPASR